MTDSQRPHSRLPTYLAEMAFRASLYILNPLPFHPSVSFFRQFSKVSNKIFKQKMARSALSYQQQLSMSKQT